jgi:hypothetical protein
MCVCVIELLGLYRSVLSVESRKLPTPAGLRVATCGIHTVFCPRTHTLALAVIAVADVRAHSVILVCARVCPGHVSGA